MIIAGFGFRSGATAESLADAFDQARGDRAVSGVATAGDKAVTATFAEFARALGLPIHPIDAAALEGQETATRSKASEAARGTGSVAEAAALAAAGVNARLIVPRVVSRDGWATCALAEGT
ncbi:MAG: cobalamin biosynthesis protein [Pseudomonadota bacterium]